MSGPAERRCSLASSAASGTDRVAEVAAALPDADILVNLQGDEPEMAASAVDQVIQLLEQNPTIPMATLATPLRDAEQLANPACVKVVFDDFGRALYFSRSQIPFVREAEEFDLQAEPPLFYQHLGIYAYRREFLLELASWTPTSIEQAEKLEQLRSIATWPSYRRGGDTALQQWHRYTRGLHRFCGAAPPRSLAVCQSSFLE